METSINKLVTDEEINAVWGNANFGSHDRRDILADTVLKHAGGYKTGHTATCICKELKLLGKNGDLTKKGKRYLYWSIKDPSPIPSGNNRKEELALLRLRDLKHTYTSFADYWAKIADENESDDDDIDVEVPMKVSQIYTWLNAMAFLKNNEDTIRAGIRTLIDEKPGCETCEGFGRTECHPDEDGFTHPCDDCQSEQLIEFNKGYEAAQHYTALSLENLKDDILEKIYGPKYDNLRTTCNIRKEATKDVLNFLITNIRDLDA